MKNFKGSDRKMFRSAASLNTFVLNANNGERVRFIPNLVTDTIVSSAIEQRSIVATSGNASVMTYSDLGPTTPHPMLKISYFGVVRWISASGGAQWPIILMIRRDGIPIKTMPYMIWQINSNVVMDSTVVQAVPGHAYDVVLENNSGNHLQTEVTSFVLSVEEI